MKIEKILLIGLCFPLLLILSHCSDDDADEPEIIPIADLGADQTVSNGDVVTIDFSASTAPANTQYVLGFQEGPSDNLGNIEIVDTNGNTYGLGTVLNTLDKNETFSFIANRNGTYVFEINVAVNNAGNDIDNTNIVVSGAIELTTSSLSSLSTLSDQNNGSFNGADYFIDELVEVTSTLTIEGSVDIEFGTNGGLIINGGSVTASSANFYGDGGWKGILLKSGSFDMGSSFITNAGASAFDGYDQTALTVEAGGLGLVSTVFSGTTGINVNLLNDAYINSSFGFSGNTFDATEVIYCDFFQLDKISGNNFSASDALITVTGGGDTFLAVGDGSFSVDAGFVNYYFKGGVTFGQSAEIILGSDKTIYAEEGTEITFSGGVNFSGNGSTLQGWNDAGWIGIYVGNTAFSSSINGLTIEGAGSAAHSLSLEAAAVYNSGRLSTLSDVTINNSLSYGLYLGSFADVLGSDIIDNLVFSGNAGAPIAAPADLISPILSSGTHTFSTPDGVETIRLLDTKSSDGSVSLTDLGGDNYYLAEDGLVFGFGSGSLDMAAGTQVKFPPNKSIYFGILSTGSFTINGTSSDPVILEALDDSAGWGGVYVGSTSSVTYSFDYATIKDGGASLLTGATENANLILRSSAATYSFTNCTISDSKGWGVVLESFSSFYDFEAVENNNTFQNNVSGDMNDKTF